MRHPGAALAFVVAACANPGSAQAPPDTSTTHPDAAGSADASPDASLAGDRDGDGLDDAYELQLATDYLPFVSIDPGDGCTLDGFVVRVRPHPANPTKILITYDHLFQTDCGVPSHVGDDEVFGVAVDPSKPAPEGIVAILAASHQNTPCERDTQCSTCGNGDPRPACDMAMAGGKLWPVVYASKSKHGQYASMGQCPFLGTCFDVCTLATAPIHPPIANAGEPAHPLITDLTAQGFITSQNGWTEASLMHFDPWGTPTFGSAGNIASDLADPLFEAAPCN